MIHAVPTVAVSSRVEAFFSRYLRGKDATVPVAPIDYGKRSTESSRRAEAP